MPDFIFITKTEIPTSYVENPTGRLWFSHGFGTGVRWTNPVYVETENKLVYSPRCFTPTEGNNNQTPSNSFLIFNIGASIFSQVSISETPPDSYGWRIPKGELHPDGKIYYPIAGNSDSWFIFDPSNLSYTKQTTMQISNNLISAPSFSDDSQVLSCGVKSMAGEIFFIPCNSSFSNILKIDLSGKLIETVSVLNSKKYVEGVCLNDGYLYFREKVVNQCAVLRFKSDDYSMNELSFTINSNVLSSDLFFMQMVKDRASKYFTCGQNNSNTLDMEIVNNSGKEVTSTDVSWVAGSVCSINNGLTPDNRLVEWPNSTSDNNEKMLEYNFYQGNAGVCENKTATKYGIGYVDRPYINNLCFIPGKLISITTNGYSAVYTYDEVS